MAGDRPHYYCLKDTNNRLYRMIQLPGRIDKYRRIAEEKRQIMYRVKVPEVLKRRGIDDR